MPAHSKRTPEMVEAILEGMSKGQTLTSLCAQQGINVQTWHDWLYADEALNIAHTRARETGFDVIAEDCFTIADDKGDDPASRRVRTDVRLKLLAKWDPKRYGDKQIHSGDPDNPIATVVDVSGLSVDALRELAKLRLPE